jgi:hypothetical protein
VRIDEVHREEPRLALGGEVLAAAAQPAHAHRGRDLVVQVPAAVVRDDVADAHVVAEAVGLHLLREDLRRRAELVDRLELLRQVPLALVGGVVPGVAQQVADRADVGRQAADPREVRVVEHLRVLDVAAGVQHRARRRAHARVDAVVLEHRTAAREPLVRRQPVVARQLARPEETFLVGEDEKDVVRPACGLPARRRGAAIGRRRRAADGSGHHAGAERPERCAPVFVARRVVRVRHRSSLLEKSPVAGIRSILPLLRSRHEFT